MIDKRFLFSICYFFIMLSVLFRFKKNKKIKLRLLGHRTSVDTVGPRKCGQMEKSAGVHEPAVYTSGVLGRHLGVPTVRQVFPRKSQARHPRGDLPLRQVGQSLQGGYRRTSAFRVVSGKLY